MKKVSKFLALVLVLAMLTMLAGCGSLKKTVQGDWLSDRMDFTDAFMEGLGEDEEALEILEFCDFGKVEMAFVATFNDDDTVVLKVEPASFEAAMEGVKAAMVTGLKPYFENLLTEAFAESELELDEALEIMDYEDLDAYIEDMLGGSISDFVEEMYSAEAVQEMADSMTRTGTYTVEKGSITINVEGEEESVIYTKANDSLTFLEEDGDLVFSRVKG